MTVKQTVLTMEIYFGSYLISTEKAKKKKPGIQNHSNLMKH